MRVVAPSIGAAAQGAWQSAVKLASLLAPKLPGQLRQQPIAMTPAINLLRQQKITHQVHEYSHDPGAASYGLEAAEKLGLDPQQVFKTLVVQIDGKSLAVAIIPVAAKLGMKQIAKATGGKKAEMADPAAVERSTGYVLGGVSPLGQKRRLPLDRQQRRQPAEHPHQRRPAWPGNRDSPRRSGHAYQCRVYSVGTLGLMADSPIGNTESR